MKPYHLNTYEQGLLGALSTGLDSGMDPMAAYGIYDNTMSGAIERRQTRQSQQQQGLSGLMDAAAQMAAGGADPQALQTYLAGQASSLPLMRGDRGAAATGGLMEFANGLYEDGSQISGLASPELRAQYGTTASLVDEADRGLIGQLVLKGYQEGRPFMDLRQQVSQNLIVAGYEPMSPAMEEAMQLAEQQYQQITGVGLGDMRSAADQLRQFQTTGDVQIGGEDLGESSVTDYFGALARDPGKFQEMIRTLNGAQPAMDAFYQGASSMPDWAQGSNPTFTFGDVAYDPENGVAGAVRQLLGPYLAQARAQQGA